MPAAVGDTVTLSVMLTGSALVAAQTGIQQAVGGRPILLRDSVITADVDTEGNAGFRGLNPRTAVGLNRRGTRLWLAVIDGRQPGRSMGMTLRQTGMLLQALGAAAALNLDGGGSSALALRDLATGAVRVVNTPSDPVERPVGNAMAVLSTCAAR
jgi:exopolysaccharide biosynthesis protein